MTNLIAFNKPFGVLCQFRRDGDRPTLADYIVLPGFYPAGRLDRDSEGLMLLTSDGALQHRISHPKHKLSKTYWAQVEREPDSHALAQLRSGVLLDERMTAPAKAQLMEEPAGLWARDPPVRYRKSIPTTWLQLTIAEGRNRQVRRMTAAVGFPTLRLIRASIGAVHLKGMEPGTWKNLEPDALYPESR
jgi:23S rRNA pseudouridine2457 synthase